MHQKQPPAKIAVAVAASLVTYVGAAWSLTGFVPERIPLHRTMLAQVAGDFATLVSPPTLGSVAINMRFLTKAGLHPALAGASVGVSQVAAFVVHLLLLLGFGIAAGTQAVAQGSVGKVKSAYATSPASLEPHHPDLYWYGVHGCESLYTVMGTGCVSVKRDKTSDADVAAPIDFSITAAHAPTMPLGVALAQFEASSSPQ